MSTWRGRVGLRGVLTIISGSLVGQGLVIAAYPLLTRLYDPAEFGLLTVFSSIVGVAAVVSTAALQSAIPIPVDDRDASAVAFAALGCVITIAAAGALVGFAAGPLADLLGTPGLADLWWIVAPTVLAMGAYVVLSQWMVRTESYSALARRNVFQGMGQVGTQIGLGAAGVRPAGLLLGLGVGRLVAMGGLLSRRGLFRQEWPSRAEIRAAFSRFRRFPLLSMPSKLVNSLGLEAPLLLFAALYGDARVGLLGLAVRVIGAPSTVVGQAVQQVFTGRFGKALRQQEATLGTSVRAAVWRLLLLGAVPALVLVVFGPSLFGIVFGPAWVEAGEYARYLAVAYLFQFAVVPVSATLFLLERQARDLSWAVMRLVLTVGGPAVCAALGAPVATAVLALAAGHVISYAVLYGLSVHAADASDAAVARRTQEG